MCTRVPPPRLSLSVLFNPHPFLNGQLYSHLNSRIISKSSTLFTPFLLHPGWIVRHCHLFFRAWNHFGVCGLDLLFHADSRGRQEEPSHWQREGFSQTFWCSNPLSSGFISGGSKFKVLSWNLILKGYLVAYTSMTLL